MHKLVSTTSSQTPHNVRVWEQTISPWYLQIQRGSLLQFNLPPRRLQVLNTQEAADAMYSLAITCSYSNEHYTSHVYITIVHDSRCACSKTTVSE